MVLGSKVCCGFLDLFIFCGGFRARVQGFRFRVLYRARVLSPHGLWCLGLWLCCVWGGGRPPRNPDARRQSSRNLAAQETADPHAQTLKPQTFHPKAPVEIPHRLLVLPLKGIPAQTQILTPSPEASDFKPLLRPSHRCRFPGSG